MACHSEFVGTNAAGGALLHNDAGHVHSFASVSSR
jgi:hypothetical protein